jgi:hypothetical protein
MNYARMAAQGGSSCPGELGRGFGSRGPVNLSNPLAVGLMPNQLLARPLFQLPATGIGRPAPTARRVGMSRTRVLFMPHAKLKNRFVAGGPTKSVDYYERASLASGTSRGPALEYRKAWASSVPC